jgi:hypothetical protein
MVDTNPNLKLRLSLLHTLHSQLSLLVMLPLLFLLPRLRLPTTHTLLHQPTMVGIPINPLMRLHNPSLSRDTSLHTDRTGTPVIPNLRDTVVDTLPTSNLSNKHTVCNPNNNNPTARLLLKPSLHLHELSTPILPLLPHLSPPHKDGICQDGTMLPLLLLLQKGLNQQLKNINQHPSCLPSPTRRLIQWLKLVWQFKDKDHQGQLHLHLGTNLVYYRPHPRELRDHHRLRQ